MNSIIFNEKITENNYMEFVEQILNVFRLSNFDKYILFSLRFDNSICVMKLSVLNHDGNKQEFEEVKLDSNESFFYSFLEYMVQQLREHCDITKEDFVNLDDDHYVAFRMITKYNDLITIDGLAESQAKRLLESGKNSQPDVKLSIQNTTGGSNILGFILMIISLIISIITVVSIVD